MSKSKCPNCVSYKLWAGLSDSGILSWVGKTIMLGGCLTMPFALVLFFPLLFVSVVVVVVGWFVTNSMDYLDGTRRYVCRECGMHFKINRA